MSEQTHETAEHKRAGAGREQAAARSDQAATMAPPLQLLRDLQQTAGNQAVNRIVQNYKIRQAAAPPMAAHAVQRAPDGGAPSIQRDGPTGGGSGGSGGGATVKAAPKSDTYTVTAKTLSEAADKIRTREEAGETVWKPKYTTTPDDSGNVASVTIDANITVTMPKWAGAAKLTGTDKTKWDNFMAALQKHEDGHVALATKKLQETANTMIGQSLAEAAKTFKQAIKDLQKDSDAYDAGNDHGRKEGTVIDTDDDTPDKKSAIDLGASDLSADSGTPSPDTPATATV